MQSLDGRLNRLAATQHRLVTRQQAIGLGLTARQISLRVQNGVLTKVHRNVFAVGGVPQGHEQTVLAACLATRGVRRLTSEASLAHLLDGLGDNGRRGTAVLRRLLEERHSEPTESILEDAFVALLDRYQVEQFVRQYRVKLGDGRELRLDFADPEIRLDIEIDGRRWHSTPANLDRDRRRDRLLVARGWTVLRYSWDDLRSRGVEVVDEVTRVRLALRSRVG
ncbi:MAG: endonuclease domain-containing protein [Actinomycetota bacterium]|nr:endonuclease domain-containing protein [Actinomycetota bacterium]